MHRFVFLALLACACAKTAGPEVRTPEPVVVPEPVIEPSDGDGDGVTDDQDACPAAPGPAPGGCPDPDTDKDGIPDAADTCVTEPETWNKYEDGDGCPDQLPQNVSSYIGTIEGVFFASGKATINPKSWSSLDSTVAVLREYPSVRVEASGHTDDREKAPAKLALRRAQAVRDYVVERGVAAGRVDVRGAGADEPIGDNSTAKGRAKNRRVQFTVFVE